ncbi:MAG: hypothetical protein CM15mP58_12420 [Burkholderiaceae bacterium]|nr:MAG: hypothetical protein CM15mP58_12420 [Burkholderiaceae bacterium]
MEMYDLSVPFLKKIIYSFAILKELASRLVIAARILKIYLSSINF